MQALSVEAEGISRGLYRFEETARITATRAWHLPPDDVAKKSHSSPVDIAVGDAFLSGSKTRVIPVQGIKKGSLVFFEFEATERPYFLNLSQAFFEGAPVTQARFELETPPGWTVRSTWLRGKGPDPLVSGESRVWEMRDLPAPVEEEMGPPPDENAATLGINLIPPAGARVAPAVFPDWRSVSLWYDDLSRGLPSVTPAIESVAKMNLPEGGSPGPLDKVLAAATMVRDRVRYVAVELGIGGFQPRPATETLAKMYGDCKDKGTLLQAVLTADAMTSYPVLVNFGGREALADDVPVWRFNHLVTAVTLPPDLTVPDRYATALLNDADLGRLLVVDSTDEFTSIGSLSAGLAGQRALLAAGGRGKLVSLPTATPVANRLERRWDLEVRPDDLLAIKVETRLLGAFASQARRDQRRSSLDRRRVVEARFTSLWPDAVFQDYAVEEETADGAFVETVTIARVSLRSSGGETVLRLFPIGASDIPRVPLGKRKSAVDYRFPGIWREEVMLRGAPVGLQLPQAQQASGAGWEAKTSYRRDTASINASWELRLSKTRFEPGDFAELRKFWTAASSLESELLHFTR